MCLKVGLLIHYIYIYNCMLFVAWLHLIAIYTTVASFTKEVDPRLAKRLLETNVRLTNLELTSLVKEGKVLGVLCCCF